MNKLLAVAVAVAVSTAWSQSSLAQEGQSKAVPVEFFSCNWQKGKGMADLDKLSAKFSTWADENNAGYSAWVLTPQFTSDLDFDVAWMGSWPDGNAFGKGQDAWNTGGRELAGDFDDVVDCHQHQLASAVVVNAPDGPPGDGVVIFAGCTLADGKTPMQALEAHGKVGADMKTMGSKASSWVFFPGAGAGEVEIDYWQVLAFKNYTEMGAATEMYINGGGWEKAMETMTGISSCSSSSIFDAKVVRNAPAR